MGKKCQPSAKYLVFFFSPSLYREFQTYQETQRVYVPSQTMRMGYIYICTVISLLWKLTPQPLPNINIDNQEG